MLNSELVPTPREHEEAVTSFFENLDYQSPHQDTARMTVRIFNRMIAGNKTSLPERAFGAYESRLTLDDSLKIIGVHLHNKHHAEKSSDYSDRDKISSALLTLASEDISGVSRNYFARSMLTNYAVYGRDIDLVIATSLFLYMTIKSSCSAINLSLLQGLSADKEKSLFGYQTMLAMNSPITDDFYKFKKDLAPNFANDTKFLVNNPYFLEFGGYIPWHGDIYQYTTPNFGECVPFVETPRQKSINKIITYAIEGDSFYRDLILGFVLSHNFYLMTQSANELLKQRLECKPHKKMENVVSFAIIAKFFEDLREKGVEPRLKEFFSGSSDEEKSYRNSMPFLIDQLEKSPISPLKADKLKIKDSKSNKKNEITLTMAAANSRQPHS